MMDTCARALPAVETVDLGGGLVAWSVERAKHFGFDFMCKTPRPRCETLVLALDHVLRSVDALLLAYADGEGRWRSFNALIAARQRMYAGHVLAGPLLIGGTCEAKFVNSPYSAWTMAHARASCWVQP